jgi:hypothetical protein
VDSFRQLDEETAGPIIADLVATLGITTEQANQAVRQRGGWFRGNGAFTVAENVQQWLHDMFIDPVWPACPHHHTHPLWLVDQRRPRWTCPTTNQPLCDLGQLATVMTAIDAASAQAMRARFDEEV